MINWMLKKIYKQIIKIEFPKKTVTVTLDRLGIPIVLKALSVEEIIKIKKECTYNSRDIDEFKFGSRLIIESTTNFNWNNQVLLDAFQVEESEQLASSLLLAGEMSLLANKAMELSKNSIIYASVISLLDDILRHSKIRRELRRCIYESKVR